MATEQVQTRKPAHKPLCPVCQRADMVRSSQAAFDKGIARLAPPEMPTHNISMMKFISVGMVLVGIGVFFILVLSGAGDFGFIQLVQVIITLAAIVSALILSFVAFQRIVKNDVQSTIRYPAWDRAMANWRHLFYCERDNVVFDATQGQVVSDQAIKSLLKVEPSAQELSEVTVH